MMASDQEGRKHQNVKLLCQKGEMHKYVRSHSPSRTHVVVMQHV